MSLAKKGKPCNFIKTKFHKGDERIIGKNNKMWKGGKYKHSKGYTFVLKRKHPFTTKSGYVLKHRLVMEKYLGRYLNSEEVVHHINGNPSDNRLENLMLFPNNAEHTKFHKIYRKILNPP